MKSLWGEEFNVETSNTKKILSKIKKPKKAIVLDESALNKRSLKIEDRLAIIYENVNRILGRYKENTLVIKTKEELSNYIDAAISNGIIAIDTETNNSLDPLTCKLMGPCIYTPGQKNAYIPVNHTDLEGNRLDWQLTEKDVFDEFSRLNNNVKVITHNGKFDYKVLYCTIGWKMPMYYDTLVGARLLDENDKAGLKYLYTTYIDQTIEKYSIDHLFENVEYSYVDPNIFALYAATDSFMTYELYNYQLNKFNGQDKLWSLFMDVEMPVLTVSAEMELSGIKVDKEYAYRLSEKYHKKLDELNVEIDRELESYKDLIAAWRQTEEANKKETKLVPADDCGPGYYHEVLKTLPSKSEQLKDPIKVTSPTQLAILLYDILKAPSVSKKTPRGTGEDILEKLSSKYKICELILKQRAILKLLNAFIDVLPAKALEKDGKIHTTYNTLGADTGRFSCKDPNLQQIPSHNKDIRMIFSASEEEKEVFEQDNCYIVSKYDDILIDNNIWIKSSQLKIGDKILNSENTYDIIKKIEEKDDKFIFYIRESD